MFQSAGLEQTGARYSTVVIKLLWWSRQLAQILDRFLEQNRSVHSLSIA